MSKKSNNSREKATDEVERLLESAQDELLLKLSVDSHAARVPPDYLNPDLHRRFQALKSRPSVPSSQPPLLPKQPHHSPSAAVDEELKGILTDDLTARFAALKASLPSSSSSSSVLVGPKTSSYHDDNEEDEVDKVIRWAMDAARLDPSPPSDDEDDGDDDDDHDNGRRSRK